MRSVHFTPGDSAFRVIWSNGRPQLQGFLVVAPVDGVLQVIPEDTEGPVETFQGKGLKHFRKTAKAAVQCQFEALALGNVRYALGRAAVEKSRMLAALVVR